MAFPQEYDAYPPPALWTDRNWRGLHSLLSFGRWREQPHLAAALLGGADLHPSGFYGSVRYLKLPEVREIAAALQTVTEKELQDSFDPETLNTALAPLIGQWRMDDFPHLWKTFILVRDFFAKSGCSGYAVLVFLS